MSTFNLGTCHDLNVPTLCHIKSFKESSFAHGHRLLQDFRSNCKVANPRHEQQKRLEDQVRKTNVSLKFQRIRRKPFTRLGQHISIARPPDRDSSDPNPVKFKMAHRSQDCAQRDQSLCARSFSGFLRQKNRATKNVYLKNFMNIFGNALPEKQKRVIEKQITAQISKLQKEGESTSQAPAHPERTTKSMNSQSRRQLRLEEAKKYTVCHLILENLLQLMAKDTNNISLKHEHSDLYKSIKQEMVSALLQTDTFTDNLRQFNIRLNKHSVPGLNSSRRKKLNSQKKRQPYYFSSDRKNEQIEQIMEKLKEMLCSAYRSLGQQQKADQFLVSWHSRSPTF